MIDPKAVDVDVICGGLIGAIAWDIITWLMALPPKSSMPSSAVMHVRRSPKKCPDSRQISAKHKPLFIEE
jgi:hypothetical protein